MMQTSLRPHSLEMTYLNQLHSSRRALMFFAVLLNIFPQASAGYAGGPYVVWVNLDHSSEGERVDRIIANHATAKSVSCSGQWKMGDSLLYMKKRPAAIGDELVKDVFLGKNKNQKKRLSSALRRYKDADFGHYDGLDGIIVYAAGGEAKMMSLTTGKNKIESVTVASHGNSPMKEDVEDAFCALLPPITRAP